MHSFKEDIKRFQKFDALNPTNSNETHLGMALFQEIYFSTPNTNITPLQSRFQNPYLLPIHFSISQSDNNMMSISAETKIVHFHNTETHTYIIPIPFHLLFNKFTYGTYENVQKHSLPLPIRLGIYIGKYLFSNLSRNKLLDVPVFTFPSNKESKPIKLSLFSNKSLNQDLLFGFHSEGLLEIDRRCTFSTKHLPLLKAMNLPIVPNYIGYSVTEIVTCIIKYAKQHNLLKNNFQFDFSLENKDPNLEMKPLETFFEKIPSVNFSNLAKSILLLSKPIEDLSFLSSFDQPISFPVMFLQRSIDKSSISSSLLDILNQYYEAQESSDDEESQPMDMASD